VQVVVDMVKNKLAEEEVKKNGWLLDGYPRRLDCWIAAFEDLYLDMHANLVLLLCSGEQAEAIEKEGIRPDVFLLIEASSMKVC
jgi:adenylate kinase